MASRISRLAAKAALMISGTLLGTTALHAAPLVGQTVTITNTVGAAYLAYGYVEGPTNTVLTRTIGAGAEVGGTSATDWIGSTSYLPTTLDIDDVNGWININYYDYPYGARVDLMPWTVTLDLSPTGPAKFTNIWRTYNTSAYQGASATVTDYRITLNLGGGFLNNVFPYGPHVFWTQFAYSTAPNAAAAVPEPASWTMMIAGFGLAGGATRRRRTKLQLQSKREPLGKPI